MTELMITSSVLILVVIVLRHFLKGKISLRLQYALWALVLLRLLVPVTLFESPISVMNPVVEAVGGEVNYSTGIGLLDTIGYNAEVRSFDGEVLMPSVIGGARDLTGHEVEFADGSKGWMTLTDTGVVKLVIYWTWYTGIAIIGLSLLLSNLSFGRKLRKTRKKYADPPLNS